MKFWRFFVTASAIAIAALAVTAGASSDINQNTTLQEQDSAIYLADSLTISERRTDSNDWNLYAERAKKKTCLDRKGLCLSKETAKDKCSGKLVKKNKCESKKHICCISANGGCPDQFIYNNGNCFLFSSDLSTSKTATWDDARKNCKAFGSAHSRLADLAELGNPFNCGSDGWLMETITAKGHSVWLGAQDRDRNGKWFWAYSGRSLSLDSPFWAPDEPNNHDDEGEYCLDTKPVEGRTPPRRYFNDFKCGQPISYVCQLF